MLNLNWYSNSPIDFEHKNYLLLSYLAELDASFSLLKLSPYLLWSEKLVAELNNFNKLVDNFNLTLKKELVSFSFTKGLEYSKIDQMKEINEIFEIIDYSKPILISKIKTGYTLYKRYPQLLY
jgi:hypothetical protein